MEAEAYLAGLQVIEACSRPDTPCTIGSGTALKSVSVDESANEITIDFNEFLGFQPMRSDGVRYIEQVVRNNVSKSENYAVSITTGGFGISELVPNLYRDYSMLRDESRVPKASVTRPIILELGSNVYEAGLSNRHIALWPSHGWYYEHRLNRWEWQRARLFQTVEDLLPFSFVIPYLAPMLENAGANVFIPRERDIQTNEVVVDNDTFGSGWSTSDSLTWSTSSDSGFGIGHPPYQPMDRPFRQGTFAMAAVSPVATDTIRWTPDIPEEGEYAIYIAYATVEGSTNAASYSVNYSGGTKHFSVNQQIGGRTWIYLGTFHFFAGAAPELGSVYVTNGAASGRVVTADAVRFGGGMGNVERNGQVSGRPRYTEAARYFMQYSGMPDSLVFDVADGDENDYVDDYRSRGEWVNYLRGNPYGPNKDTSQGLGIPIDLSLAFHTDAGVTKRDTTIGTLLIYSTPGMDTTGVFPDGVSRLANRDFADILQTEITHSIRSKYDSTWTRRSMWDKDYSEAHRPNVPAALLELLSHQNFEDGQAGMKRRAAKRPESVAKVPDKVGHGWAPNAGRRFFERTPSAIRF